MSKRTTRRAILAGAAGTAAAFPLPASAPAADPILGAIARHHLVEDRLNQVLAASEQAGFDTADNDRPPEKRQAWSTVFDACAAILNTVPTTQAGIAALLWYVQENERRGNSFARDDMRELIARKAVDALAAAGLTTLAANVTEEWAF